MLYLLRDTLFPVLVFLHTVLLGAPANHGRGKFTRARYAVHRVGRLPSALRESSGLARADTLGGLWCHGDGGTPARLTLITLPGKTHRLLDLAPLPNTDWEDLAQDPAGYFYIGNFGNNANLDAMGFAPFGEVIEGKDVVNKIYTGYGEGGPRGKGPEQGRVQAEGNAYLTKEFPKLDFIKKATIEK